MVKVHDVAWIDPPLYKLADSRAVLARRVRETLTVLQIACALGVPVLPAMAWWTDGAMVDMRTAMPWALIFLFSSTCLGSFVTPAMGAASRWVRARAVAQAVQSLAWRYAMGLRGLDAAELVVRVRRLLDDVGGRWPVVTEENLITPRMRALRATSPPARAAAYEQARRSDQEGWYRRKVDRILGVDQALFLVVTVAQWVGLGFAIAQVVHPGLARGGVLVIAASVAGGVYAIRGVRRDTELQAAYAATAVALKEVGEQHEERVNGRTATEDDVQTLVNVAEAVMGQEVNVWLSSRDPAQVMRRTKRPKQQGADGAEE